MPLPGFRLIKADSVTGSKPQISITILNDRMYLVVYQRLLVPNRMFYPIIIFIPIIHYRNSCRIISQPNTFFFININNINIVSVHCIIAFIISSNIRMCNTCIHIHFMYSHPFRSNQQFFLIQRTDSGNIYITQINRGTDNLASVHIKSKNTFLKGSDK